jgi:hypothetical protein
MKNILNKYWPLILFFGLSFLVTWPLLKGGYFSHQDDLQVIRIFEMRRCFSDLQIPCRWVPDMGWGNGIPLFNFYGVFPYYLGAIFSYFVGYITSAKILFFIALIFGSWGIYLLVKSLWGRLAGLTAAVLYMFAPYKALDVYVRGALAESIALAIVPFVFYFAYALITTPTKTKYRVLFTFSLFFFLTTHNIMTTIFLPVLGLWILYWLVIYKWKSFWSVVISTTFGLGLSAFFILPAFFEKNLIQTSSLTRFELDFRANFVKFGQLFWDRSWGYGTSIPGPLGGMSFQIGWPHWFLVLIALILLFVVKAKKSTKILVAGIIGTFLFSIFMTHNKSTFIWTRIDLLKYFQFPWRFLSLSIFTASILGGFIISVVNIKWQSYISLIIIILTVGPNWSYFRPQKFVTINDTQKLSGQLWDIQKQGALLDYLPLTALEPRVAAPDLPIIASGSATVTNFVNRSNTWEYKAVVKDTAVVEVPVFYFPDWTVTVNGKMYPLSYHNYLGRISITLPAGSYTVKGYFKNTPLRNAANVISIISLVGLLVFLKWKK